MSPTALGHSLIGLSVSEPPAADLVGRGLGELHVRHAFIEVARHLLAAGKAIAYGGDVRDGGYSESLFDLARTYSRSGARPEERVRSYLAWPLWVELPPATEAEIRSISMLMEVAPPASAPNSLPPVEARDPIERLWASQGLRLMREEMTADIDARLVLGGRVTGQQGLYPGLAEEAYLALLAGKPLFVAGGFGGCAYAVACALKGERPAELSLDYQMANTASYRGLRDSAEQSGQPPDYDGLVEALRGSGLKGLRNGLDEDENRLLLVTDEVDQIVALVLRGLRRLDQGQ